MEEETKTVETTEEVEKDTAAEVEEQTDDVDSEKIVEKLQKRLASKTASEKETKTQLEQALARISELEKGAKKSVKEKSEEEKLSEAQKAKDEEIATLRKRIRVAEIAQQADEVLKESGLSVGKDILSIIVSDNEEKTYSNVKAVLAFLAEQQKQWEVKRNTGTTPRKTTHTTAVVDDAQFKKMTYAERVQLAKDDPEQFKKLTGGY